MHLKLFFFFNFGCSGSWCFVRAFSLVAVGVRGATLVTIILKFETYCAPALF